MKQGETYLPLIGRTERKLMTINGISGFLQIGDYVQLIEAGYRVRPSATIVEIGSFLGLSASAISIGLLAAQNVTSKIYCIDPWPDVFEGVENTWEKFKDNMIRMEIINFIAPLRMTSTRAVEILLAANLEIDLLFIDGDHTYKSFADDIRNFYPLCKSGSTILIHDCCPGGEPKRAFDEYCLHKEIRYEIIPPLLGYYMAKIIKE